MSFDESDKAENEKTRRRRAAIWAVLFLLSGISLCVLPALRLIEPEKPPSDASRLESVEYICQHIELPEQFVFVEKTTLADSSQVEVFYKYRSERSFEELAPYFAVWFGTEDWERAAGEALKFQRKKYTVTIEKVDFPHYNYLVKCAGTL